MNFFEMIDGKAVLYSLICTAVYISYRKLKKTLESNTESNRPHEIEAHTKLLIDELHELKQQHANLCQFILDTEQEKESRYNISYTTADGQQKTAEIIKAADSTPYIQGLTQQQIKAIESRMQSIIYELNKPIPYEIPKIQKPLCKVTQTENKEEQRLRKHENGGLWAHVLKLSGEWLRAETGDCTNDIERDVK